MEFLMTTAFVLAILSGFIDGFNSKETTDVDDYQMTEEEEAAYHFEFFHRRQRGFMESVVEICVWTYAAAAIYDILFGEEE